MDSSVEEGEQDSELKEVKKQLEIQQNIYVYLVKKLAELKQEQDSNKQKLSTASEDLRKEKETTTQLQDSIIVIHHKCTNFFTNYQDKLESFDELNLSWLYIGYNGRKSESQPQHKSYTSSRPESKKPGVFSTIEAELESCVLSETVQDN